MKILRLENVSKYYKSVETVSVGMKNVTLSFDIGEFVAITGESGSGKSTLLNVISGLDGYEDGEVYHYGDETSHFTIADWEKYRSAYVGFVFQNYNIIDSYTVYQNVMFALEVQGYPAKDRKDRALKLIDKVGLTSHKNHKASKLSGGQKQRAVIARALAKDCPIIVADEPTGNLDSESAKQIMGLLNEISQDKLVIVVTHDYSQVEDYATRRIKMHDGLVAEDKILKEHEIKEDPIKAEVKKVSFMSLLRISLRNIFATPKRTIFLLLLQILVIGIFTITFSSQIKSIRELGRGFSYDYRNMPETRLLVERRDGKEFESNEIKNFEKNRNVLAVYENYHLFYNETQLYYFLGDNSHSINKTDSSIVLNKRDVKGSLPKSKNEVVMSQAPYFKANIGDTIKVTSSYNVTDYNVVGEFVIVGFDKLERNTIYFSEEYLSQTIVEQPPLYLDLYDYMMQSLNRGALGATINGRDHMFSLIKTKSENPQKDLEIDNYRSEAVIDVDNQTLIVEYTMGGKVSTLVYEGFSARIPQNNNNTFYQLMVKEEIFDEIVDDFLELFKDFYTPEEKNMLSITVSGYYDGDTFLENIDNDIYRVYYPAGIKQPGMELIRFLSILMSVIFLGFFGVFLYTIVHAVSKNVMANRNKDFAIYRSIGASKKLLAQMVVLEQVILNLIGFILVISVLNLIKMQMPIVAKSISYMRFSDYLILGSAFLLFGIWIGLRFNKKVFNQSVIEVLTMSRGDL